MELYRIAQEKYAADLSGNGARMFGGRWNSEGHYALYTASSRSLALLEILAHVTLKLLNSKTYILITLHIPEKTPSEIFDEKDLPSGWNVPGMEYTTQKLGDKFLEGRKKLLLGVPSVLMPEELNYILNPRHLEMKHVKIKHQRVIRFNDRLVRNLFL